MNKLLLLFLLGVAVVAVVQADEISEDRRRIAEDRRRLRADERRLREDEESDSDSDSDSESDSRSGEDRRRIAEDRRRLRADERRWREDEESDSDSRSGEDRRRVEEDRRRLRGDERRLREDEDDDVGDDRRRVEEDRRRLRADKRRLREDEDDDDDVRDDRRRVEEDRRRLRADERRLREDEDEDGDDRRRWRPDDRDERRDCRDDERRDCEWHPWRVAIHCSVSCGRGQRLLVRRVKHTHCNGGRPCEGRGFKVEPCNTHKVCLSRRLDEFCRDRGDGEFGLGHCTDVYARCRGGRGKVHDCRHGHRFSHREGHCVPIENVDECSEERDRCKDREDGKHKLGECREDYLFCNGRRGHVRRCRRHHVFDPSFKGCAPKSLVAECRERDRGCRDHRGEVVEGHLAVNRHACHEWYKVCKDGHPVLAKCPEDKPKFNPFARRCETRHHCERAIRRGWESEESWGSGEEGRRRYREHRRRGHRHREHRRRRHRHRGGEGPRV